MAKRISILGGGPGGYTAAIKAAQRGVQVTLIEGAAVGGTCLNHGCIPTKAYLENAKLYRKACQDLPDLCQGGEVAMPPLSLAALRRRKDGIVRQLVGGIEALLKKNKVELVSGWGTVLDPRTIEVSLPDGGKRRVQNEALILATGSVPIALPFPGAELPGVLDSSDLLRLDKLPERLVVIGSGVIGVELAQIFADIGSRVTLVRRRPRLLASFDQELVRRLAPLHKKQGLTILTAPRIEGIERTDEGLRMYLSPEEGKEAQPAPVLMTDAVLGAIGRRPSWRGLERVDAGLAKEGFFVKTDAYCATSLPEVYAIGDLIASPMLAHVAAYEAEIAVGAIMGEPQPADYRVLPICAYIRPELAGVGLNEEQARDQGIAYRVGKFPFSASGRALTEGETAGLVKLIAEEGSGRLLGGHILGPHASELIHELAVALRGNLSVRELGETIHAHPTLAESIMEASWSVNGRAVNFN